MKENIYNMVTFLHICEKELVEEGLLVKPCDPARFLFSSFDLLARSKDIWMSSALSTRKTWRPSPLVIMKVRVFTHPW